MFLTTFVRLSSLTFGATCSASSFLSLFFSLFFFLLFFFFVASGFVSDGSCKPNMITLVKMLLCSYECLLV